tara:strand:- start:1133 stop:1267 length:135 start_codon:yes stop_codon:yes gene_type:complete
LIEINDTGKSKDYNDNGHNPNDKSFESLPIPVLANVFPFDVIWL